MLGATCPLFPMGPKRGLSPRPQCPVGGRRPPVWDKAAGQAWRRVCLEPAGPHPPPAYGAFLFSCFFASLSRTLLHGGLSWFLREESAVGSEGCER